jgi:hypothetical protein
MESYTFKDLRNYTKEVPCTDGFVKPFEHVNMLFQIYSNRSQLNIIADNGVPAAAFVFDDGDNTVELVPVDNTTGYADYGNGVSVTLDTPIRYNSVDWELIFRKSNLIGVSEILRDALGSYYAEVI